MKDGRYHVKTSVNVNLWRGSVSKYTQEGAEEALRRLEGAMMDLDALVAKRAAPSVMAHAALELQFYGNELLELSSRLRCAAVTRSEDAVEEAFPPPAVSHPTGRVGRSWRKWVAVAGCYLALADIIGFVPGLGVAKAATGYELTPLAYTGIRETPTKWDLFDHIIRRD